MDARLLPDYLVRLISPQDRLRLGLKTKEEMTKKLEAKNERQLQRQIVDYLRLRNIEVVWHATHKKSTATKGTPDILFAVMSNGFPMACAYEIKFGSGAETREQSDMHVRMTTRPNAWRVRVIRNFIEVVDDLREMGL